MKQPRDLSGTGTALNRRLERRFVGDLEHRGQPYRHATHPATVYDLRAPTATRATQAALAEWHARQVAKHKEMRDE